MKTCACCGQEITSTAGTTGAGTTVHVDAVLMRLCNSAYDDALRQGCMEVEVAHLVGRLVGDDAAYYALRDAGVSTTQLNIEIDAWLAGSQCRATGARLGMSPGTTPGTSLGTSGDLKLLLRRAHALAMRQRRDAGSVLDVVHILLHNADDLVSVSFLRKSRNETLIHARSRHAERGKEARFIGNEAVSSGSASGGRPIMRDAVTAAAKDWLRSADGVAPRPRRNSDRWVVRAAVQPLAERAERSEHHERTGASRGGRFRDNPVSRADASIDPGVMQALLQRLERTERMLERLQAQSVNDRQLAQLSNAAVGRNGERDSGRTSSRFRTRRGPLLLVIGPKLTARERWQKRLRRGRKVRFDGVVVDAVSRQRDSQRQTTNGRSHLVGVPARLAVARSSRDDDLAQEFEDRIDHLADGEDDEAGAPGERVKRFYLAMDDDIVRAPAIGQRTAERLRAVGIMLVRDLLACDPLEVSRHVGMRSISPRRIANWKAQAQLVCTVPWLRGTHAQLLVGAGYATVNAIASADATVVCAQILHFSSTREGQRVLRAGPPPDIERVLNWVQYAALAEPARAA